jgi:hypothetical protein
MFDENSILQGNDRSINPKYDLMEVNSIQDWTPEKQFKTVPI